MPFSYFKHKQQFSRASIFLPSGHLGLHLVLLDVFKLNVFTIFAYSRVRNKRSPTIINFLIFFPGATALFWTSQYRVKMGLRLFFLPNFPGGYVYSRVYVYSRLQSAPSFEAVCFLIVRQNFVSSLVNFGKRYEIKLKSSFEKKQLKIYLGQNVEPEIKIVKVIYCTMNPTYVSMYVVTEWPIIGIGIRYSSEFTCHSTLKQQGNVELLLFL